MDLVRTPVRILVVEDDAIFRIDLCLQLRSLGYTIAGEADRGDRAIDAALSLSPDVVLLDIALRGGIDGIEVARRLHAEVDTPVVFVTANSDDDTFRRAVSTGPFGYVLKPVNLAELRIVIEMALYKHDMERRLRDSERRYSTMFENHHAAMVVIDPADGRILDVNAAALQFFALPRDRMLAMRFADLTTATEEDILGMLQEAKARRLTAFHIGHCRTDEEVRDIEVSIGPVLYDQRPVLLGILHDVTDRLRAELALKSSEEQYRLLFEGNPHPMWMLDPASLAFLAVNQSCLSGYEYTREEMAAMTLPDLHRPSETDAVASLMREDPTSYSRHRVWVHRSRSGRLIDMEVTGEEIPFNGRRAWLMLANDVTEARRAQDELRRSEDKYRTLYETMSQGVVYADREGRVTSANDAARSILGTDAAGTVRGIFDSLFTYLFEDGTPMELDDHPASIALSRGLRVHHAVMGMRVRGVEGIRWLTLSAVPQFNPDTGAVTQVSLIMNDISQRKMMEEELRGLSVHLETVRENERTEIAREIHDELGQQLTALKINLVSLLRKHGVPENGGDQAVLERIDALLAAVRRISTDLRPGVLDDLGLVDAVEWQLQRFGTETGITCRLEVSAREIGLGRLASTVLFRCLQELLTNIIRHAQCTEVRVRLMERPGSVELKVTDNGRGITPEEIAAPTSLGILGIRERVQHLHGTVSFTGDPGGGTTVLVRLPHSRGDQDA